MNAKTMWFFLIFLVMTGCASKQVWMQEGKTETETERDFNDCYAQATQKFGADFESPRLSTAVKQCMESRGYKQIRFEHRTTKPSVAPVPSGTY